MSRSFCALAPWPEAVVLAPVDVPADVVLALDTWFSVNRAVPLPLVLPWRTPTSTLTSWPRRLSTETLWPRAASVWPAFWL